MTAGRWFGASRGALRMIQDPETQPPQDDESEAMEEAQEDAAEKREEEGGYQ